MDDDAIESTEGRVVVRFADGELLEGHVDDLDLDRPELELDVADGTSNNRRALIPLPSVTWVTLHRGPSAPVAAPTLQKVAFRFRDGEVLKGLLRTPPWRARHGLVVELLSPDGTSERVLGIPWQALEAVFYLRDWEGNPAPPDEEGETPLVDLVGDITRLRALHDRGEITGADFDRRRRAILDLM